MATMKCWAQDAMRQAEEALRQGDLSDALDHQADAMSNLRDGIRSLNQALAQSETDPNSADGMQQSARRQGEEDPLGRQSGQGNSGISQGREISSDSIEKRAEEILKEIRRRAGERERQEDERQYLNRLLEKY